MFNLTDEAIRATQELHEACRDAMPVRARTTVLPIHGRGATIAAAVTSFLAMLYSLPAQYHGQACDLELASPPTIDVLKDAANEYKITGHVLIHALPLNAVDCMDTRANMASPMKKQPSMLEMRAVMAPGKMPER
jgi:dihydroorotase-like cyclic amidohydrolase